MQRSLLVDERAAQIPSHLFHYSYNIYQASKCSYRNSYASEALSAKRSYCLTSEGTRVQKQLDIIGRSMEAKLDEQVNHSQSHLGMIQTHQAEMTILALRQVAILV